MFKPLFSTGTSRGGTTFFARLLSAHSKITQVSDPFIPFFQSLRTTIIRSKLDAGFDASQPFDDYYFSDPARKRMEAIQEGTLDILIPPGEIERLRPLLTARMSLAAAECVPFVDLLQGETYLQLLESSLHLIQRAYQEQHDEYVGFNDNWIIEFFPLLARAFPSAQFFIMLRDPRGMAASMLKQSDPKKVPFIYSACRQWRKYAAFAQALPKIPDLKNRLFVVTYEQLVHAPEEIARNLCRFLEVPFEDIMLDTTKYQPLHGETWKNWSNFDVPPQGIYKDSAEGWRNHLEKGAVEFVEFVCEPEMKLFSYIPEEYAGGFPSQVALKFLYESDKRCQGWRGRYESLEQEIGYELFRKQFLLADEDLGTKETRARLFLFDEVWERIRGMAVK